MVFIYALALENNKYYIGKTDNPHYRIENHFSATGSEWTKIYKPLKIVELIANCDHYDEDKYTRIYMDKYGIDNVRGGSFVSVVLPPNTIEHLRQMSNGTNDKCFKCGGTGHFAKYCREATLSCRGCRKEFVSVAAFEKHWITEKQHIDACFRCGRAGHVINNCYAATHANGKKL